jgi:hypothetical protein
MAYTANGVAAALEAVIVEIGMTPNWRRKVLCPISSKKNSRVDTDQSSSRTMKNHASTFYDGAETAYILRDPASYSDPFLNQNKEYEDG